MECSWNRRRGERKHVHLLLECFELLFLLYAKAMLFIDDDKSKVEKLDVTREHAVGADEDIEIALPKVMENFLGLLGGIESAEKPDFNRIALKPCDEGLVVLLDEKRRDWRKAAWPPVRASAAPSAPPLPPP